MIKYEHPFFFFLYIIVVDSKQNAVGIGEYFEKKKRLKPVRILKTDDTL